MFQNRDWLTTIFKGIIDIRVVYHIRYEILPTKVIKVQVTSKLWEGLAEEGKLGLSDSSPD